MKTEAIMKAQESIKAEFYEGTGFMMSEA